MICELRDIEFEVQHCAALIAGGLGKRGSGCTLVNEGDADEEQRRNNDDIAKVRVNKEDRQNE